jgi:hypothetical protein
MENGDDSDNDRCVIEQDWKLLGGEFYKLTAVRHDLEIEPEYLVIDVDRSVCRLPHI